MLTVIDERAVVVVSRRRGYGSLAAETAALRNTLPRLNVISPVMKWFTFTIC